MIGWSCNTTVIQMECLFASYYISIWWWNDDEMVVAIAVWYVWFVRFENIMSKMCRMTRHHVQASTTNRYLSDVSRKPIDWLSTWKIQFVMYAYVLLVRLAHTYLRMHGCHSLSWMQSSRWIEILTPIALMFIHSLARRSDWWVVGARNRTLHTHRNLCTNASNKFPCQITAVKCVRQQSSNYYFIIASLLYGKPWLEFIGGFRFICQFDSVKFFDTFTFIKNQ